MRWVSKEGLEQFVENRDCPLFHSKLILLWKNAPPHIFWHVSKERNNKIFREEEKLVEVVVEIMEKLQRENVMSTKCKTPKEAPGRK